MKGATRVVTFDVSLPTTAGGSSITRWDNLPAFSDGYAPASEAIRLKVRKFLEELAASARKK